MENILALDVGFANTGWAVFSPDGEILDYGVIVTQKSKGKTIKRSDDYAIRSGSLAIQLADIIDKYQIYGVVGELPTGGAQSAMAMAQMNMATAIVASVCALKNVPTEWCTPTEVKLAMTGIRSATKEQMMDSVRIEYPDVDFKIPKTYFEHVADAIGAYKALRNGNLINLMKKFAKTT
jgi:Holliday junction resolvasome RuvABC endonuclease subunit